MQDELDKHLKQAIHEKMSADEAMNKAKADLQAKVTAYDELTKLNQKMQEDLKLAQKQDADQKTKLAQLEEELKKAHAERDSFKKESEERKALLDKQESDVKEAAATLIKLEEARIVLNRLIGPGGSFTPQEREKHLSKAVGYKA